MVAGQEASPQDARDEERLKRYWAFGPGAAKWKTSETPYRTLRALLAKYVDSNQLDGLTANIFHMALGFWPGTTHVGIVPTPGKSKGH